jgi:hypothetical protein
MQSRVTRLRGWSLVLLAVLLAALLVAAEPWAVGAPRDPVITAAGDIAAPNLHGGHRRTAELVERIDPNRALTLGDNQYPNGELDDYQRFYDSSWGQFKGRTAPTPGNHEYRTPAAAGYLAYFGLRAVPEGRTYYSYDLGGWHLIALDSNIDRDAGSAQERWLRADLAGNRKRCVLAYWHHPRFSSGSHHGNDPSVGALWEALHDAGADVVLNGHEHNYERFAHQDPRGRADPGGIRQFVVGTGGNGHYGFGEPRPNSQVRDATNHGVLKLTLHPGSYEWDFVSVDGEVVDSGGPDACH